MPRKRTDKTDKNLPASVPAESGEVLRQEEMFPDAVEYAETTYFAGPLPAPQTLYEYDQILPGAADRIIGMAEREAQHRHTLEREVLKIQGRNSTFGIFAGLLVGLAAILGGVYCVAQGADLAGAGVALTGLAALVGVFITQRQSEKREVAEKSEPEQR